MANDIRRRYNFISGIIDDNPLSNSATTLNSTELAGLAAVGSSEHVALVLDPTGVGNGPEIVWVTAHTGSATSATIVRGREGTTAVSHASTIAWAHVATAADYSTIGDDNDQPSGTGLPYEGQTYVDTTNNELEIYDGSAWAPFSYGAWTTWTPTVTQSNTPAQSTTDCRYMRLGRLVVATGQISFTGAGTGSNAIVCTLPVTARTASGVPALGTFQYFDSGTTQRQGSAMYASTTTVNFSYDGYGNVMGNGDGLTIANGDILRVLFTYEAAS